jgi:predicted SAM-dependent methyltransferase
MLHQAMRAAARVGNSARLALRLSTSILLAKYLPRSSLNVVIGAGETLLSGWLFTDRPILDITKRRDWERLFAPRSIDRILCEHVLEHLSLDECRTAMTLCFEFLRPSGLVRIAVPDGYRRDPGYVAEVSPPKDGHKVLYTVDTIVPFLQSQGFLVTPLEYFDASETFHFTEWDVNDGLIRRSRRFDRQTDFRRGELFYTSLIVDARKPE